ncbi:DUF2970 domain-containing protein [Ideonella sp.]|uniref:DUF2970 domain-containing protein n=1 Tax=Ideonella sp. TaxID=1929293 RepID=UPI002B47638C|nr:DUF2970 domain-containing protein [Ideonella sp.]HJV67796.1 DUF2970 domain-containing protein [Ideonella sp.]
MNTQPPKGQDDGLRAAAARKGSFLGTMRAVAWSFLGIRKGKGYEQDVSQLNPVHVVIAGVIGAAIFVLLLIVLVNWMVGSGAAS